MDHASLSKLNVAKLKERCKELKITGYSKLSKPLLIEKLLSVGGVSAEAETVNSATSEAQPSAPLAPETTNTSTNVTQNDPLGGLGQARSLATQDRQPVEDDPIAKPVVARKRPKKKNDDKEPVRKKAKKVAAATTNEPAQKSSNGGATSGSSVPLNDANDPTSAPCNTIAIAQQRIAPHLSAASGSTRVANNTTDRAPLAPPPPTCTSAQVIKLTRPTPSSIPCKTKGLPSSLNPAPSICPCIPSPRLLTNQTQNKAPMPQILPHYPPDPPRQPQSYKHTAFQPPAVLRPRRTNRNPPKPPAPVITPCPEQSLDFSPPKLCTSFPLISMPPSTARRRQAERMSIVFSGIADNEVLGLCVKVSRAWRYAVSLSATHALNRDFVGTRLDSIRLQIKEPRMTNMWAYLRVRRLETTTRYNAFRESWLGRFFASEMSDHDPVSWEIWTSPDDDRQITVALRFVSTRVVFGLARRHNECDQSWVALNEKVVGVEEVVPCEIWKVTTSSPRGESRSFHILYDTGEAIGFAPPPLRCGIIGQRIKHRPHIEVLDSDPGELRADWRGYILSAGSGPSLQDTITSADRDSYVAGVSTFWLRSLSSSLEDESARRIVAKRYVLCCVEPNSISGEYKSVIDMARDVTGITSHSANRKSGHKVGLYISEHHLVESVHLPTSLHPALAMVVTAPGREYFVLRDTGMPIGTSDQGLEPLWQRLMGCDAWGNWYAYTARAIG